MVDYTQRIAGCLNPIPGDLPAGADARYEPSYEEIRTQIASLDTPTGGQVDWNDIANRGQSLLTTQSKDILIACYTAYALYQVEGLVGLASGLSLVSEITDKFWDDCWPKKKRLRARVGAVDWLTERVCRFLADTPVGPGDHEAVSALKESSDKFSEVLTNRYEDSAPAIRPLFDSIKRLELSLPAAESPAEASTTEPVKEEVKEAPQPQPAAQPQPQPAPEAQTQPTEQADGEVSDPTAELAAFAEPYLAPISDDTPGGAEARYEPEYETIRSEVGKLESLSGGAVDWAVVEKDSTTLLQGKSKDFLIAAHLAAAMYEQRGLVGLAQGLALVSGMFDKFWDTGFPKKKRLRARVNAVSWLIGRLDSLADCQVTADDKAGIAMLDSAAKQLSDIVFERFEDEAPAMRPLLNSIKRLSLSVPEPEPVQPETQPVQPAQTSAEPAQPAQSEQQAAQPAQPAPEQTQPTAQPAPTPAKPVEMPDTPAATLEIGADVSPYLKKIGDSLHKAAQTLFDANPVDPLSYRLNRIGLYLHIDKAPPASDGQKTMVPPPGPHQLTPIETMSGAQNWAGLLKAAETMLGVQRYWLDLHRFVVLSLRGLGHTQAADVAVAGTADLIHRIPDIQNRQFNDDRPFASPETLEWINSEVLSSGQGGGGQEVSAGGGLSEEDQNIFAEARKLAVSGKVAEAVEQFGKVIEGAKGESHRFRAKLAMAQACASGGAHKTADGIFTGLLSDIDTYRLDKWEPDLAQSCYAAHYKVLKILAGKKENKKTNSQQMTERLTYVYARLCQVSPSQALKLEG